ncbi:MAG TPA: SAM-dependent methyltransferase [Pseudonocardiaceae bacterium]|nr:SAM-dependent methyltransferase [Pseudonocardiaceae bacterium]
MQIVPGTGNWTCDEIDQLKPSGARVYDYLLGGAHNFAVDRALAHRLLELNPGAAMVARVNRGFLRRAVLLMIEQGIRQFLDLGSGIPTVGNVHEIAQKADPASRVVYVDIEEVSAVHSRMLLEGDDNAALVQADIARPQDVLDAPETRQLIDFDEPLGLLAVSVLHYLSPEQDPVAVMRQYASVMVPGSYVAISHGASDFTKFAMDEAVAELRRSSAESIYPRSRAEVTELFVGFELVEPGLVTTSRWRPDWSVEPDTDPQEDALYAGVGRKNS